jgi:hypothetical protein
VFDASSKVENLFAGVLELNLGKMAGFQAVIINDKKKKATKPSSSVTVITINDAKNATKSSSATSLVCFFRGVKEIKKRGKAKKVIKKATKSKPVVDLNSLN